MIYVAIVFGTLGFAFGIAAYTKVGKLESELKKTKVLNKDFTSN